MARVLVIGGAGYVGSSVGLHLADRGHEIHVLDNLSTGRRELCAGRELTVGDAGDADLVAGLLRRRRFDCVMHFAASSLVEESVRRPEQYRRNNVDQTRALLGAMLDAGVQTLVFSSTAAVYGVAGDGPIAEQHPRRPVNPYGASKLEAEGVIGELARTRGLRAIALRYFNVAGAEPGLRTGERHDPETHLVPRVLAAAARGAPVEVYGRDYPTPDGTCIRDYVHVVDLAAAHLAAMERLASRPPGGSFEAFNLGGGRGRSVLEVIEEARRVTGAELRIDFKPRREGDPPVLVADAALAGRELGFRPLHSELRTIVDSAWKWMRSPGAQSARHQNS